MYLNQHEFLKTIFQKHINAQNQYEEIRFMMRENPNDYTPLHLKCYHCHGRGHIAIQCEYFDEIKGNLNKKFSSNRE